MLRNLIRALVVTSSAVALVAGVVAAGASLEYAVRSNARRKRRDAAPVRETPAPCRADYFRISRTKSEVGYVYWILEGFGRHKCFILFDTWQEAMDEASRRRAAVAHDSGHAAEELALTH